MPLRHLFSLSLSVDFLLFRARENSLHENRLFEIIFNFSLSLLVCALVSAVDLRLIQLNVAFLCTAEYNYT